MCVSHRRWIFRWRLTSFCRTLVLVVVLCAHQSNSFLVMQVKNTNHARKNDAFKEAQRDLLAPCVILVREAREDHVGMTARNLLNFGLARLRLVDSAACDHRTGNAVGYASGAGDVLRAAELYATLAAACDGIGHVFAVMGAVGDGGSLHDDEASSIEVINARQAACEAFRRSSTTCEAGPERRDKIPSASAFVFGAESSELALLAAVHGVAVSLVCLETYWSRELQLPQQVSILAYEWFKCRQREESTEAEAGSSSSSADPASTAGMWRGGKGRGRKLAPARALEAFFERLPVTGLSEEGAREVFRRSRMTLREVGLLQRVVSVLAAKE